MAFSDDLAYHEVTISHSLKCSKYPGALKKVKHFLVVTK